MFVAFEGVDGAGKSTQVRLLGEHLERNGREVVICREPGGTSLGEELRRILLDPGSGDLQPEVEVLLFMAARAQLWARRIHVGAQRRQGCQWPEPGGCVQADQGRGVQNTSLSWQSACLYQ